MKEEANEPVIINNKPIVRPNTGAWTHSTLQIPFCMSGLNRYMESGCTEWSSGIGSAACPTSVPS